MKPRSVHFERKMAQRHNFVSEHKSAQNICIFAVFLIVFFLSRTRGHTLNCVQNLEKKLKRCVKFPIRDALKAIFLSFCHYFSKQRPIQEVKGWKLEGNSNWSYINFERQFWDFARSSLCGPLPAQQVIFPCFFSHFPLILCMYLSGL